MKKVPKAKRTILVWPYWPSLKEQQRIRDLKKEIKPGEEKKQTPEQVIRSLQGVFCGGRYRSWVFSREEKPKIVTTLKPPLSGRS